VVIVGASFAGLACARSLRMDFKVTLVDQRDYFEYTPGILRLFVKPEYLKELCASITLFKVSAIRKLQG
jgi:NADH dehydrogenase FAD-containing subunit